MLRRSVARFTIVASAIGVSPTFWKDTEGVAGKHTDLQLVECPRDAMQGLRDFVPTERKIEYINALLKCGFHTVDCGSFVSAPAVPQMADTAQVLKGLDMTNTNSKLLVVVCNLKGAVLACKEEKVTYVGYPLSVSEIFQQKNTRRDIKQALLDIEQIHKICEKNGKVLVTYISMAFGNPYKEDISIAQVQELVEKVASIGCRIISLADTVGTGTPDVIEETFTTIIPKFPEIRIGGHFHSGATTAVDKVTAALKSGCRRLDSAIGGMGGCPFAKSALVGNVPTEGVLDCLDALGVPHPIDMPQMKYCHSIKHDIFGVAVKELVLAQTLNNENWFRKLVNKHFDAHDKSGTGYLEKPEFAASMREVFAELGEEEPPAEKIERSFQKMDLTGDGVITIDEYMVGARRMLLKRLKEME